MNEMSVLFWAIAGFLYAIIVFKFQQWSVKKLTPEKPTFSLALILGGSITRWILMALILYFAFSKSILAGIIFFIVFFLSRSLILFSLQIWPTYKNRLLNRS